MALFDFFKKFSGKGGPQPKAGAKSADEKKQPVLPKTKRGKPSSEKVAPKIEKPKMASRRATRKKGAKTGRISLKESRFAWRVLREPHVTEKSTYLVASNKYTFKIFDYATKPEVKRAIEDIYGVDVINVNKVSVPRKQRRRGRQMGWRSGYTKAIVTLKEGDKIEVLPH